jgi:hypothetical protein
MSTDKTLSIPDDELSPDSDLEASPDTAAEVDQSNEGDQEEIIEEVAPIQPATNNEDERWTKIQNNLEAISRKLDALEAKQLKQSQKPPQKPEHERNETLLSPPQKRERKNRTRRLSW